MLVLLSPRNWRLEVPHARHRVLLRFFSTIVADCFEWLPGSMPERPTWNLSLSKNKGTSALMTCQEFPRSSRRCFCRHWRRDLQRMWRNSIYIVRCSFHGDARAYQSNAFPHCWRLEWMLLAIPAVCWSNRGKHVIVKTQWISAVELLWVRCQHKRPPQA